MNGVRLAVPVVDPDLVQKTTKHFRDVLSDTFELAEPKISPANKDRYATRGFSIYQQNSDLRRVSSLDELKNKAVPVTPPRFNQSGHHLLSTDEEVVHEQMVTLDELNESSSFSSVDNLINI